MEILVFEKINQLTISNLSDNERLPVLFDGR